HQQPTDILYCEKSVKPAYGEAVSKVVIVNTDILPFSSLDEVVGIRLVGEHNLINCAFVYEIAKTFDINEQNFISALQSYIPLRHRLEFIGKKNDVDYYDDSISTTAESTINAIKSIPNLHTILLGGMERGINYDKLVDFLVESCVPNIICMYESGKRIYETLEKQSKDSVIIYCKDLYKATETAQKTTPPETACLLSPASASYGDFTNFAERGDVFRRIVFGE
ncbi:MAG: hypothetical protein LBC71_07505, partial [Oscillospiraceae bacterium]|nr:hypothetical protein [Oscillospiraceae bacterium]